MVRERKKENVSITKTSVPYAMTRVGLLMSPEEGNDLEVEGVLNPASARDDRGNLYVFPRIVAEGNRSRVGRARVVIEDGVPVSVERNGVALEPERSWEHGVRHGGTEDPRITTIESLGMHVMTYVAFGPTGPRPAIAVSGDLETWTRLGPILFDYDDDLDIDLNIYPNKDVVFFPSVIPGPDGVPSYAALHRPMWDFSFSKRQELPALPTGITDDRPSIWISYVAAADVETDIRNIVRFGGHRFVAGPEFDWEAVKIGAGPAPIRVDEGWLLLHHGVSGTMSAEAFEVQSDVRYSAGAMILSREDPSQVIARTESPLLEPATAEETHGIVSNVVFPTAIEKIGDFHYVFYGMADSKIGVARLDAVD